MSTHSNAVDCNKYMQDLLPGIKRQYDRSINRDLSQQNSQGLFKRNVVTLLQQTYTDTWKHFQPLLSSSRESASEKTTSLLATNVLDAFSGLADEVVEYALQRHRTSCALSNFPDEHAPDPIYVASVYKEIDHEWQAFVDKINATLN